MRTTRLLSILMLFVATVPSATVVAESIDLAFRQFGVGNTWRAGETTGMLLDIELDAPSEQQVLVEWELPTPDGDMNRYGRMITLSPGQRRSVWLYAPLPQSLQLDTSMQVRMSRVDDGEEGDVLGTWSFKPRTTSSLQLLPTTALIGVVGTQRAGLDQLSNPTGDHNLRPLTGNEATAITTMSNVDMLPDRWEGWLPYEAVVWTDAEPNLRPSQIQALHDWMRRGGHLAIILPSTGNPWNLGSTDGSPLGELMPRAPRRDEQGPMRTLLQSLTTREITGQNGTMPIRIFRDLHGDFDALPSAQGWTSVHALEDGRVWAAQRPVDHGQLTLIGLDLSTIGRNLTVQRALAGQPMTMRSIPDADLVWNRILGRRADTPDASVLDAMKNADRLNTLKPTHARVVTDALVAGPIEMQERASSGLLLAFLFFITYWILAVPGSWWWLSRRDRLEWSWAVFSILALVGTVVGWLLVEGLQDRTLRVRHLTVLDHVHQNEGQHARSWMSIYLPGYGDRAVELAEDRTIRNLLQPWAPHQSSQLTFPDSADVTIDLDRRPDRSTLPGRATTTNLYADWYGQVDSLRWGGTLRMDPDDPVRLERDATGQEIGLRGSLLSDLPATLEQVRILWVTGDRMPPRRLEIVDESSAPWLDPLYAGRGLNRGHFWGISALEPGGRIDLSSFQPAPSTAMHGNIETTYRPPETKRLQDVADYADRDRRKELELLGLYGQLPPPTYHQTGETLTKTGITQRKFGRELDLSPWLGRPCLIVTGFMENSELPVPLVVDGADDDHQSSGLTMIRWILPLPQHDPAAFDL